MKNYGHFNNDGSEYIITEKILPRKWDNYLWNKQFFCRLMQDGSGESFYKHSGGLRTALNKGKRCIFIRDNESGNFWTTPGAEPDDNVVYGIGYGIYNTVKNNIETSLRITIPEDMNGEGWKITVHNKNNKAVNLSVFSHIRLDLSGYCVIRKYRETVYDIEIINPEHVSTGVKEIYVDGYLYKEQVLPISAGKAFSVKVVMGK